MSKHTLTATDLDQFTGTEHWYRHGLIRNVTYTDGAKYMADHAGAHWLLDIIAIAQQFTKQVSTEPFQYWLLEVNADSSAVVTADDGNGKHIYHQSIAYTDFPPPEIRLYCCRDGVIGQGVDWVILLPDEY